MNTKLRSKLQSFDSIKSIKTSFGDECRQNGSKLIKVVKHALNIFRSTLDILDSRDFRNYYFALLNYDTLRSKISFDRNFDFDFRP